MPDIFDQVADQKSTKRDIFDDVAEQPTPPSTSQDAQPNSVAGGFLRRGWETVKGTASGFLTPPKTRDEMLAPPGTQGVYRTVKGMLSAEDEAHRQSAEQFSQGKYGRGIATEMFSDPLLAGTAVDVNRLIDQKRYREAIGTAAFDALMDVWGMKGFGAERPTATRVSNISSVAGETGETVQNVSKALPEIDKTARTLGQPRTIGDLWTNIKTTRARIDQEFNQLLFPVRNNQVMPLEILRRIKAEITPDMAKTAEGRAEAKELNRAAREFEKPWTLNELNARRVTDNNKLSPLYKKDTRGQSAALTSVQEKVHKASRDGSAEIVYREIQRANPSVDAADMKQKQGATWKLSDQLENRIGEMEDKQATQSAKTIGEKLRPHAYVSAGGPRVHLPITGMINEDLPIEAANRKVTKAFSPPVRHNAARAAVLALPVAHLSGQQMRQEVNRMPPPPELSQ